MTPDQIRTSWLELRSSTPGIRAFEAARQLGLSEGQLVAACCGQSDGPLRARRVAEAAGAPLELLGKLHTLGTLKTITRNPNCVLEIEAPYDQVEHVGHMAQMVGPIDLRIFSNRWKYAFELTEQTKNGERSSIQFFDQEGVAIHKVYAVEGTDKGAWSQLVDSYLGGDQSGALTVEAAAAAPQARPDSEIDVEGLRKAWSELKDTHEFFGLLRRFGVTRTQALRLCGEPFVSHAQENALERILRDAAAQEVSIMIFVGNKGLIQIFTGKVHKIAIMGPWVNVLDKTFNLHALGDQVSEAWIVRKPTVDGLVTALELYSADGEQMALVVGERKPGRPEDERWRALVESLKATLFREVFAICAGRGGSGLTPLPSAHRSRASQGAAAHRPTPRVARPRGGSA